MLILGISGLYHDSAACLLRDGRIVTAVQEERLSRRKHDARFPVRAITACLAEIGALPGDIDLVAFHEKPLRKLERVLETTLDTAPAGRARFVGSMPRWMTERLRVPEKVRSLGIDAPVIFAAHHESHAASAFFGSPFDRAAVLINDGVGEWATSTLGVGEGSRVELLREVRFPHSLGLLYSAFTRYLGFEVNEGEYKVMGLAPYGEPRFVDRVRELIEIAEDGSYRLRLDAFDFLAGDDMIGPSFGAVFGRGPRAPDAQIEAFHRDVAASVQRVLEEVVLAQARHVRALTGADALCLAGGVALNAVANGRLLASGIFRNVWVQPAAGDAGAALGAAWVGWHHHLGLPRAEPLTSVALGPVCTEDEITAALAEHSLAAARLTIDELADAAAEMLAAGAIVAIVDGRAEMGPRALGCRSILADPRRAEARDQVNASVKFRESFRPFAPAVLAEHATASFASGGRALPFMTFVVPVIDDGLPAITHVDGTARVQTVAAGEAPLLRAILTAFERRTGCSVLLNTSFNVRGQPIVGSARDGVQTLLASGIDALVVPPFLVRRPADVLATGIVPSEPSEPRLDAPVLGYGIRLGLVLSAGALACGATGRPFVAASLAALCVLVGLLVALRPALVARFRASGDRFGLAVAHAQAFVALHLVFYGLVVPLAVLRRLVRSSAVPSPSWTKVTPPRNGGYRHMS